MWQTSSGDEFLPSRWRILRCAPPAAVTTGRLLAVQALHRHRGFYQPVAAAALLVRARVRVLVLVLLLPWAVLLLPVLPVVAAFCEIR